MALLVEKIAAANITRATQDRIMPAYKARRDAESKEMGLQPLIMQVPEATSPEKKSDLNGIGGFATFPTMRQWRI